ncbi:MAG: YeeE/YedE family protein [Actinomycetota bacterium]|nr:YeeE/YedE family protein [Actinomycetota bacterium]
MTSSTHTDPAAPVRNSAPPAPAAPAAQPRVALVGAVIGTALVAVTFVSEGWAPAALLLLGVGLGFALFHARFGFTSAWRQLVAVGQGRALRAHTLLLGATAVLFAPFLALSVSPTGVEVTGNVAPVGIALLLGATLFGFGMQIAGSCASGTLYAVGSGQTSILLALAGFVGGATVGAAHLGWWDATPSVGAVDLVPLFGGVAGALTVTLLALGLIAALSVGMARRRNPPPVAPVATAAGPWRVVRGAWPLWVGALALAVLNLGVLLVSGSPWGVTTAFSLWGSKAAGALGIADPATWDFWSGARAEVLGGSVLAETTGLTNLGIMVGAMVASALAGAFRLHRRVPARLALGAVVGGLLMGYGARLAYGCNIGAYLGGIASLSLHGWVWGVMALLGTWFGVRARPWFGLSRPRPSDGVC